MENEENLKGYTAEDLKGMCARGENLTDWSKVDADTLEGAEDDPASWDWSAARFVTPDKLNSSDPEPAHV